MHILQHRLASVRRRWRFLVGMRGLCAIVGVVVGAAALIGLTDWYVHLPSLIRAYGLVAILVGAGVIAYRWLVRPMATRCDDLSLALRIEDAYPELNDSLASTVQFIEAESVPGSAAMRERAIDKASDATAGLDFGRILDRRGLLWCFVGASAACALAGHFLWHHAELSHTALWRLIEPFGQHTWTRINLDDVPTRIAVGQPFQLRGQVEGIVPAQVKIEIEGEHPQEKKFEKRLEKVVPLKLDAKTGAGAIVTALDVTQHRGKFRFRVLGNDGRYPPAQPWQEVLVLPPPAFAMLDGLPSPQITLFPPEYAELPTTKLSPGTRHLELVQGTHVVFRAAVDRPLHAAWIDLRPLDPGVRLAPWLGMMMQPQPLEALGSVAVHQAFAGRYPAALDASRQKLHVEFMPWVSGAYVLHLVDADSLAKDYEADLRITLDPAPVVQVLRPTSSVSLLPDAEVIFRVLADDDFFAIRSVYLEMRLKETGGKASAAPPRRLMMYDPAMAGWVMSRLMPGPLPTPWIGPELKLRPKRLELGKVLALNRQFKEGDVLAVQACAEDFCNITKPRPPGRSPEIEIRIVGKSDLAKMIDEGLGQVQQELVRLQKLQQEAMDLVKQLEKQKPGQKAMDQLVEAEQLQKQIQERIGNRQDEGLRDQLQKLDQLVKDNKLPATDAIDHVKELQNELNRLSQEELPKIEENLQEARKEMTGTQKPTPEKKQAPLDKAGKLQQQAKDALDQLSRTLDKFADIAQIKGQLREQIAQQREIAKNTEALKNEQQDLTKKPDPKKTAEFRDNAAAQKEAQENLAEKTEQLQSRIEKVLEQQNKGDDQFGDLSQKLKKAGRLDEKERAEAFKELAKQAADLANRQDQEGAKETLKELAGDLEKAANQLDKGKMPEEAQSDFQKKAQQKLKQAQNEASPQPVKNLKEAAKIAEESNVPDKMRQVGKDLAKAGKNKDQASLDKARANQDEALKNMEKMLAALEGQNDDGLDRLRKKQKQLAKAEENVDRLGKKAKDAQNTKDPKERAEELRGIAKEMRENARELARLQEEKASKELNRAAQMLEDAAAKLDQGQEAEAAELEREANEKIEQAKKDLEQFEEELAREQLAKIADRLKGLKERQDAAVERTRELQSKLMKSKEWTRGLKQTLDADKMTQEGLAGETRMLQEKIKEAKVFEHVMDKAAKAMEQAAEIIVERRKATEERQPMLDDDDLKDETRRHEETLKLQSQAAARLQRLLDALKDEIAAQEKKDDQPPMENGGGGEQQQPRARPSDGIPPMAELKAMRAEQLEVNERTKELAQRHPNNMNLPDPARRELTELEAEQRRLREIFAGMTAKKGEMP